MVAHNGFQLWLPKIYINIAAKVFTNMADQYGFPIQTIKLVLLNSHQENFSLWLLILGLKLTGQK